MFPWLIDLEIIFVRNNKGLSCHQKTRLCTKQVTLTLGAKTAVGRRVNSLKLDEIHRYRPASTRGTTSPRFREIAQNRPKSAV